GITGRGDLRERFLRLREAILGANEVRYGLLPQGDFSSLLDGVIEAALARTADILGIPRTDPSTDTINRIYAVRQVCWDRIFPEGAAPSPLEQSLRDLSAGEAWHASRHMELADFSWYFHNPPAEPLTLEAAVEYAQNLYDFANRSRGGAFSGRRNIPPGEVRIVAGEPLNLSDMLAPGGPGRKALIAEANAWLLGAFGKLR
ncbi:MAG: acyltransferase, partial [Spirochaetaceae bacterium]|nr:acyltransferase [Spirochaetaceae bacterium]